jgi:hypothetical protein
MAVPAAIACIGFSLACCFSESTQLRALVLIISDTSDLMCCGETLLRISTAASVIYSFRTSAHGVEVPALFRF